MKTKSKLKRICKIKMKLDISLKFQQHNRQDPRINGSTAHACKTVKAHKKFK